MPLHPEVEAARTVATIKILLDGGMKVMDVAKEMEVPVEMVFAVREGTYSPVTVTQGESDPDFTPDYQPKKKPQTQRLDGDKATERNARVAELYLSGMTVQAVANEMKISKQTVSNVLKKEGVETRGFGPNKTKVEEPEPTKPVRPIDQAVKDYMNYGRDKERYVPTKMSKTEDTLVIEVSYTERVVKEFESDADLAMYLSECDFDEITGLTITRRDA